MTSRELEQALRDPMKGDVNWLPANRLHIIRMLYGLVKPGKNGFRVHTAQNCLQIVLHSENACNCRHEGEIVFFGTGSLGTLPVGQDVEPITWTREEMVALRHAAYPVAAA